MTVDRLLAPYAIEAHPKVRSCAVIGLPDDDLGQCVHALTEAEGLSERELIEHTAELLARYKVPRSVEFVSHPLRDDAGKIRRSALLAERHERRVDPAATGRARPLASRTESS